MKSLQRPFLFLFFGFCAVGGTLHGAFPALHLKPVVLQQFHAPTAIVAANDGSGRLFVCDQPGRIYIVKDGMMLPTPFLDISNTAVNTAHRKVIGLTTGYNERGLLGLAFHPGFANPLSSGYRKFYLNYNKSYESAIDPPPHDGGAWTPNCTTVIAEFQVSAANPNAADPLSERKLLRYPQPQFNHNGGSLVFDSSGLLYIGSGDGGNSNDNGTGHTGGTANNALGNGQDKTVYLGKILRIDPLGTNGPGGQYGIPASNPFVGAGGGVKEEIYAFGIRNPWGLSFDDGPGGTGRFFCADVGQGRIEEVNLIVNGGNYGWRYMEGTERPSFSSTMAHPGGTLIDPIAMYGHPGITGTTLPLLGLSITGGYVYRGSAMPALQGKYVFADYGATAGGPSGRIMGLEETAPLSGVFTLTNALPIVGGNPTALRILCLGEDEDGEIYIGSKVTAGVLALDNGRPNGGIYKLVAAPVAPALQTFTPVKDNSIFSELGGGGEELSNGAGNLFAGRNSGVDVRRALMQFDLSSIPAGSRFSSAFVQLNVNQADSNTARDFTLHRLLNPWGEGTSVSTTGGVAATTNDATWLSRFFGTASPWDADGGDFNAANSALISVSGTGSYSWYSLPLLQDVHAWLAAPATNHGWMLRNSTEANASSAKRIDSRESAPAVRPLLSLVAATPYEYWLAAHFSAAPVGAFVSPDREDDVMYDTDGDGDVDITIPTDKDGFSHQFEYAYGFNPLVANAIGSDNFTTSLAPAGVDTDLTVTFRRDSSATDLTYRLQISSNLTTWTTIAESAGGVTAAGQNGGTVLSDNVLSGTVRLVTVKRTLTGSEEERHFVRLLVERTP